MRLKMAVPRSALSARRSLLTRASRGRKLPEPDGELKVYYGAADTCIGLATAQVDDLIEACLEGVKPARSISC